MPIGFVIGSFIALFLAYGPAFLIAFSRRASGMNKTKWVVFSLIPPIVLGSAAFIFSMYFANKINISIYLLPAVNVVGYIAVWLIYFSFKKKYKPAAS